MELTLHRVTECTLKQEHFDGGGKPVDDGDTISNLPLALPFHVTHLAILYEDGSKAKIRLFSHEKLEISNE